MPKSTDSSSSEGGFVFETKEFDVHKIDSEKILLPENSSFHSDKQTTEEINDITDDTFESNDNRITVDSAPIISSYNAQDIQSHDISKELFNSMEDLNRSSIVNSPSDSANNNIEQDSDKISMSIDSFSSKQKHKVMEVNKLPLERIKTIMKCDPDVHSVSSDAVFAMARATELFLNWFGKETHEILSKQNKRAVDKQDIELMIAGNPVLEFLDGAIDWKIPDD